MNLHDTGDNLKMTARLDDEPTGLNMLAEKVEYLPVNPDHLAYCPTMDLIALATVNEQVHVNRLNGQRVFSVISKPPGAQVRQMKWKPNGQHLFEIQKSPRRNLLAESKARSITCCSL